MRPVAWLKACLASERWRFLAAGLYNFVFGLGVVFLLYGTLGRRLHYLVLTVLSHLLAVTNAFLVHRHWTFRHKGPFWPAWLKFNLSYVLLLVVGSLLMTGAVEGMHWDPFRAQLGIGLLITLASYVVHKRVSFGGRARA